MATQGESSVEALHDGVVRAALGMPSTHILKKRGHTSSVTKRDRARQFMCATGLLNGSHLDAATELVQKGCLNVQQALPKGKQTSSSQPTQALVLAA